MRARYDAPVYSYCRPVSQVPGEVRGTLDRANYMLSIAETALADVTLEDTDKPGFRRFIKRTPMGVVLVIAPWKYVRPLLRAPRALAHARPTPATPTSSWSTPSCPRSSPGTP